MTYTLCMELFGERRVFTLLSLFSFFRIYAKSYQKKKKSTICLDLILNLLGKKVRHGAVKSITPNVTIVQIQVLGQNELDRIQLFSAVNMGCGKKSFFFSVKNKNRKMCVNYWWLVIKMQTRSLKGVSSFSSRYKTDIGNNSLHSSVCCSVQGFIQQCQEWLTAHGWLISTLDIILHSAVVAQDHNKQSALKVSF